MTTLIAKNLSKSYQQRMVLKDISLSVEPGEIVGLLGPNGAGKTTCFYMITGLVKPDSGKVFFGEQDVSYMPMHYRSRLGIGYLPQEPSIFRKLTVADNILSVLEMRKSLSKTKRIKKMHALLDEFSIGHIKDNEGITLSGGERRRVEIARALAMDPKIILLDEPFAGVDPIAINAMQQTILQLQQKGIGVFITDHNVRETLKICKKAYIVGEGKIIASGTTAQIVADSKVKQVYLGTNFTM